MLATELCSTYRLEFNSASLVITAQTLAPYDVPAQDGSANILNILARYLFNGEVVTCHPFLFLSKQTKLLLGFTQSCQQKEPEVIKVTCKMKEMQKHMIKLSK